MVSRQAIQEELARRLLLGELIARNARKFPDKEAVIFDDTRLTYREFNGRINRLAHAFQEMRVGKGDKVALLMLNCNQYLECYFALGKIGGVAVPLNFRLHPDEIAYIVNNADAVAFVVGEQFIDTIKGIQKDLPLVRQCISVTAAPIEGMFHYETLIRKYPDDEPLVLVDEEGPAFIMYTAGTTGRPKGAVLTHQSQVMMWTLASIQYTSEPGVGNIWDFRVCSPPPLFHLASFGYCQVHLLMGATLVLPTQVFNPAEIMEIIELEKIDSILLIPAMANFLLQLPDLDKYDASSLKIWASGAAVLPTQTRKAMMERFPSLMVYDCFGQTETGALVCMFRPSEGERKVASVGRPLPFIQVRVVDDEDRDVPIGEVGEAVYQGPNIMKEYYKNPEGTAQAMRNGWFHSGDLVRQDEEGYIYIVDRKTDMIVSGGENIYPAEVEEVLYRHPKILEAAVIGVYDEQWGEAVKVVVVPKPGQNLTEEEVIDFCKQHLASYKKPKSVDFTDSLPRNPAMKVLKTVLRERYGKAVKY
jgi:fatty-acyl-CoA synthase